MPNHVNEEQPINLLQEETIPMLREDSFRVRSNNSNRQNFPRNTNLNDNFGTTSTLGTTFLLPQQVNNVNQNNSNSNFLNPRPTI